MLNNRVLNNKGYALCQAFHCSNIKDTDYYNDTDLEIWDRSEQDAEYTEAVTVEEDNDLEMLNTRPKFGACYIG